MMEFTILHVIEPSLEYCGIYDVFELLFEENN